MGVEFENNIDAGINELARGQEGAINKALKVAGKKIAEELKKETPFQNDGEGDHLRDNVKVSSVQDDGSIEIGFGKKVNWRVHLTEFGTIHQRPQGFIQRTEDKMKQEILTIIQRELRKGLGL